MPAMVRELQFRNVPIENIKMYNNYSKLALNTDKRTMEFILATMTSEQEIAPIEYNNIINSSKAKIFNIANIPYTFMEYECSSDNSIIQILNFLANFDFNVHGVLYKTLSNGGNKTVLWFTYKNTCLSHDYLEYVRNSLLYTNSDFAKPLM